MGGADRYLLCFFFTGSGGGISSVPIPCSVASNRLWCLNTMLLERGERGLASVEDHSLRRLDLVYLDAQSFSSMLSYCEMCLSRRMLRFRVFTGNVGGPHSSLSRSETVPSCETMPDENSMLRAALSSLFDTYAVDCSDEHSDSLDTICDFDADEMDDVDVKFVCWTFRLTEHLADALCTLKCADCSDTKPTKRESRTRF